MWVRIAFWMGAVAFLGAVLWTVFKTKEYPPSDAETERLKTAKAFDLGQVYPRDCGDAAPDAAVGCGSVLHLGGIVLHVSVFFRRDDTQRFWRG